MSKKKDEEIIKKSQVKKIELLQDYKTVFGTEAGKRVLHDLLGYSCFLAPTVRDTQGNVHLMDRNEGRREVALYILTQVQSDIPKIVKLLNDASKNETEDFL